MAVSIAFLQVIILFCLFYYFTQHICISLSTWTDKPINAPFCCCAVDNILCSLDTWNMFCAKFACGHICTNGEVGMTARDPRHSVIKHLHHQVRDCLNNFAQTLVPMYFRSKLDRIINIQTSPWPWNMKRKGYWVNDVCLVYSGRRSSKWNHLYSKLEMLLKVISNVPKSTREFMWL